MKNIEKLHHEIEHQYQHAINQSFLSAIQKKDITMIKYSCASKNLKKHPTRDILNKGLMDACQIGYLPAIDYILTSPDIQDRPHFNEGEVSKFELACENGHLNIVQYCLETKVIKPMDDGDYGQCIEGIKIAACYGHVHVMDYLIRHPETLLLHQNVDLYIHACLKNAIHYDHLNVVQYLFQSHELRPYINIHMEDDILIQLAVYRGNVDITNYLLFSSDIIDHADVHLVNHEGETLFDLAKLSNTPEIFVFLLSLRHDHKINWDTEKHSFGSMLEYDDNTLIVACLTYLHTYDPVLYVEARKEFEEFCVQNKDLSYYDDIMTHIEKQCNISSFPDEIPLSM